MPTTKRAPLGSNPLSSDSQIRSMVRGEKPAIEEEPPRASSAPVIDREEDKPIHRTGVYLSLEEAEALRLRAFQDRRTKTDIIRSAIREYLGLNP